MNKIKVSMDILGKEYQIKCPENEVETLKKAAELLVEKIQAVRVSGSLISHDRAAIITSLNLTHQVMLLEQERYHYAQTVNQRLQALQDKLEVVLTSPEEQMELLSAE